MSFRFDINGLRAIAVLAVVLFHFNPAWLPGGFAGVDVFFVISGFLMTSIIFNGIENNSFNLFKFYNARANRIIPVLAAMFCCLLIFGWFYLAPADYRELAKQVEQSSIFSSNILFSKGGGYFDTNEKSKWLLHTWSLSVEWQFYIFFPILILVIKKYLRFVELRKFCLSLFVLSLGYCIYSTHEDRQTAYFLLSSRAWEMLFGGLAFLYPVQIKKHLHKILIQCIGLILIIASYFLISEETPWPGYMALFPVVGAYLILISNLQHNLLINNMVFRNIGKWSYSIYVWHWPLVILGLYFTLDDWWMYGIPLSILLGFISYQLIETIKLPTFENWKDILKVRPFYLFLIMVTAGYTIKTTNGMESHYSPQIRQILSDTLNENPYQCDSKLIDGHLFECKIGNPNQIRAIVVGDSHANAITTSVSSAMNLETQGMISISTSGCPFILNAKFNDSDCELINQKRQEYLAHKIDIPIILINRYLERLEGENDPERFRTTNAPKMYFTQFNESSTQRYQKFAQNYEKTICTLTQHAPVYILSSVPEIGFNVPKKMNRDLLLQGKAEHYELPLQAHQKRAQKLNKIQSEVAQKCGAKILYPTEILCPEGYCLTQFKNRSIYRDGDHLNEFGNKLLTPMFKEIFD